MEFLAPSLGKAVGMMIYPAAFVFVLTIVVFVHEFGHFWVGRLCGVGVKTFSIGFGRELFGWYDRHGTRWRLSAIPLGGWRLLKHKGSPRHRLLGKLWLAMMVVAATSALWIRHLNDGRFSAIHLLVPVGLVGSWRAVATARRGNIYAHRRVLLLMFVGGLLIPAVTAFVPGRLMWLWLVA